MRIGSTALPQIKLPESPKRGIQRKNRLVGEEPSAARNKEPSASLSKEPSASLSKEPSAARNKEPSASLSKEPSAARNKEPSAARNKEPSAANKKQPSDSVLIDHKRASLPSETESTQPHNQESDRQPHLRPYIPIRQKEIDFYNITASMGKQGGDGEIFGVDTYA